MTDNYGYKCPICQNPIDIFETHPQCEREQDKQFAIFTLFKNKLINKEEMLIMLGVEHRNALQ